MNSHVKLLKNNCLLLKFKKKLFHGKFSTFMKPMFPLASSLLKSVSDPVVDMWAKLLLSEFTPLCIAIMKSL